VAITASVSEGPLVSPPELQATNKVMAKRGRGRSERIRLSERKTAHSTPSVASGQTTA